VSEAIDLIDTANKAAGLYLACRAAGVVPTGLDEPRLHALARAFGLEPSLPDEPRGEST
jgi:hypothetical protein